MFFTLFFPNGTLVKFKLSKEEMSNVFYLVFPQWCFGEVQAVQRRGEQCFLPCFSPMVLW